MESSTVSKVCADCGHFMNDVFTNSRGDAYRRCANCGAIELTSLASNKQNKNELAETLEERGKRYGEFRTHAAITQALKQVMFHHNCIEGVWDNLTDSQREALEMIAHKIGRILNGNPNYRDSWIDIAGYAQLVADELAEQADE